MAARTPRILEVELPDGSDAVIDVVAGLKAAYGAKLARLAVLKATFDPTNLFRMNQNVAPASAADD